MSTTAATYPIVAAIKHAEQILGPDRAWQPTNETQRRFLTEFFVGGRAEVVHVPEEVGARAHSAAAVQITRGIPDPDHVINRPFLIWFERDGLSQPLFVGYITPDDWRNPGDIARDG